MVAAGRPRVGGEGNLAGELAVAGRARRPAAWQILRSYSRDACGMLPERLPEGRFYQ